MAEIKATDVKALREKTGAGMMDCKNALAKANGDFAAAEKLLKELGLAAVAKRSERATNEGKVFAKAQGSKGILVELACETDFVSKNEDFIAAGEKTVDTALAKGYTEKNPELEAFALDIATKIRENLGLKRLTVLDAGKNGVIAKYIHGDGKIGVLVAVAADKEAALADERVKAFAFDLCLHIAAFNPMYLDKTKIDPAYVREQEEIFKVQIGKDEKMQGKPANVIEGVLKGKISKHLAEICLMDQGFVKDEKQTVEKYCAELGKAVGAKLSVADYRYYKVGE